VAELGKKNSPTLAFGLLGGKNEKPNIRPVRLSGLGVIFCY